MRRLIGFPTLLTLTVLLVATGLWLRQQEEAVDQAKEADAVAYQYGVEVTKFETRIDAAVKKRIKEHPATIADVIRQEIKEPPRLPEVPAEGREGSPAYRHAERQQTDLLTRYEGAISRLDHAEKGIVFLEAAAAALTKKSPASRFHSTPVPDGASDAAAAVRTALGLDGFAFVLAYDDASDALEKYSLLVDGEIQEALEQVKVR